MDAGRAANNWHSRPEWEYPYILEPTTNNGRIPGGNAHGHVELVVEGAVEAEQFESVITSRHLMEAPNAKGDAHVFEDCIEIKWTEELGNPGAYMFKYLGKSWNRKDMEDYEKRFAALIFDQERQRFRASNGAQRWMQRNDDESSKSEWIFAGVANDQQARRVSRFDEYQDFRIATRGGVRTNLQRRGIEFNTNQQFDYLRKVMKD